MYLHKIHALAKDYVYGDTTSQMRELLRCVPGMLEVYLEGLSFMDHRTFADNTGLAVLVR